jgi:CheY-like chemotaxis protein
VAQHIVVVEDDREIRNLLSELLELEGFSVTALSHPDSVLTYLETVQPALFLIDIMLPRTSGLELAARLRAGGFPSTPMIAMSASGVMHHAAEASGLFQEVITKPFDVQGFLKTVMSYAAP